MNYSTPPERDPHLWELAHKRVSFKRHLLVYIIINIFLWMLWYLTTGMYPTEMRSDFPWPIWPTLGWGTGLFFHFISAYVTTGSSVENEYQKLTQKNNQ